MDKLMAALARVNWAEIFRDMALAVVAAYLFWEKHRERQYKRRERAETEALGLPDNPLRCRLHKESVDEIKRRLDEIVGRLGKLESAVAVIRDRLGIGE